MPGNLNRGIAEASADLVAILHDGDHYDPRLLEHWVAALDDCPESAFVFNAYAYESPHGDERLEVLPLPACSPGRVLLERHFFRRWRLDSPVFGTVMVRRDVLNRFGLFDDRFGAWSDVDMWMRLAANRHVAYVKRRSYGSPANSGCRRTTVWR